MCEKPSPSGEGVSHADNAREKKLKDNTHTSVELDEPEEKRGRDRDQSDERRCGDFQEKRVKAAERLGT